MSIVEFFLYVNNNWVLMALCLISSVIIYFYAFKKYWISVLDPLSFMILGSCMGCAVVMFLYFDNLIDPIYFFSYCTTQVCFYIGLKCGWKNNKYFVLGKEKKIKNINKFTKYVFVSAVFIDILSQLLQYKITGIPLFMSSRLNAMADAGGAGILTRFVGISRVFSMFFAFYYIQKSSHSILLRRIAILYFVYVTIVSILSGSRSSFLIFGTAFFYYVITFNEIHPKLRYYLSRYEIKILCILAIGAIIINIIKYGGIVSGMEMFGVRILAFGDTYFYAYPNNLIEEIDNSQPFKSIFSSFLGFFRIYPYSELPNPIGLDLFHFFSDNGEIGGPNSRHNIVSYLYFGLFGGTIFSFILGYITGYFRSYFFKHRHKTMLGCAISAWLYGTACGIETDVNLYFFNINSFIIVVPIILFLATIMYIINTLRNKNIFSRTETLSICKI